MKCKLAEPIFVFALVAVMLFNMIGLAVDSFGYSIEDLPEGKFMFSAMSPDSKNTLRIYKVEIQNVGSAIRGEVVSFEENGDMTSKNIYWETGVDTAMAGWLDEDTVTINDHEVNLTGDPYDSRSQIELPEASAKKRMQSN